MNRRQSMLWFGAFLVLVVVASAAGGVMVDRLFIRRPPPGPMAFMPGQRAGMPPGPRGWLGQRLADQLRLAPDQVEQLRGILDRRGERIEQIRGEMRDRLADEQRSLRQEIRAILNEEQQEQFDAMALPPVGPMPGMPGRGGGRGRGWE